MTGFLKENSALVTGGAGFIGSHLVDQLLAQGRKVTVLDNLSSGNFGNLHGNTNLTFVKGDVRNAKLVDELVKKSELIYHLAEFIPQTKAFGSGHVVKFSSDSPLQDFDVSTRGTLTVLNSARKYDRKFVFTSTAAVYGGAKDPLKEDSPILPQSPYGVSKYCAEEYARLYSRAYSLPVAIVRFFNVYGPRQSKYVMFDLLLKLTQNPSRLEMLGTGEEARDFVYIKDAITALMLISGDETAHGQVYNIGSGRTTRICEVVQAMLALLELNPKVTFSGSSWQGDVKNLIADTSRISSVGYKPRYRLEEGLQELIRWYKSVA